MINFSFFFTLSSPTQHHFTCISPCLNSMFKSVSSVINVIIILFINTAVSGTQCFYNIYIYIYFFFFSCISLYFFIFPGFKMIEGQQVLGQKFIYFIGNIVNIVLALYKCQSMGLLPSHSSDWLSFVLPQSRVEYSSGGIVFS